MFILKLLPLLSVVFLAACGGSSETVAVTILPSQYRVDDIKSDLATPVVDEVVRRKPKKVHLTLCTSTPPAKIVQFNVELQARLSPKITSGFLDSCPES